MSGADFPPSLATIIAFSVPVPKPIETLSRSLSVPLHKSGIIYELIERVRTDVAALLPPTIETRVTGEAIVQQIFEIKLKGKQTISIAGCRVGNGTIEMKEGVKARVVRGREGERVVVHEGESSLFEFASSTAIETERVPSGEPLTW